MDILDNKRIEAITPYYFYYGLQDLIPLLRQELTRLRLHEKNNDIKYYDRINGWSFAFDNTFDDFYEGSRLIVIDRIKNKYIDFDELIFKEWEGLEKSKCLLEMKNMTLLCYEELVGFYIRVYPQRDRINHSIDTGMFYVDFDYLLDST